MIRAPIGDDQPRDQRRTRGSDYKAAWSTAAARAMAAFDGLDLSTPVTLPFGEIPAGVALNIEIFDVATHAWDIAQSTGQTIADTELLETALEMGKQMVGPELRVAGVFGPEQPCAEDAPITERLFAFSGRKV